MKQTIFHIQSNEQIATRVYRMQLAGDTTDILPGQFVNIRVEGQFLRRPISVCDATDGLLTIIYKVVGVGTEAMSHLTAGTTLDVLTGLGNGYDLSKAGDNPLLVGGGVGVPPMYHNGSVGQAEFVHNGLLDGICVGLFDADGVKTDDTDGLAVSTPVDAGFGIKLVADKFGGAVFSVGGAAQMDTLPGGNIGCSETGQNGTGGRFMLIHGPFLLLLIVNSILQHQISCFYKKLSEK